MTAALDVRPRLPSAEFDLQPARPASRLVKRAIDVVLALTLLAVLAPLMLVIAAAIAVDSRGPVLFKQRRVGRFGMPFTILKFRTMFDGTDGWRSNLPGFDESPSVLFKLHDDPRVTRVGSLLRRSSLDELPQLFNVLTGRMSLIGPRPFLPDEIEAFSSSFRRRLLVQPGLTGLWQVSGRSDLSTDDAVRADLTYVDEWSLMLDMRILGRTPAAVIRGTGAY